jgi:hypothetical protein
MFRVFFHDFFVTAVGVVSPWGGYQDATPTVSLFIGRGIRRAASAHHLQEYP